MLNEIMLVSKTLQEIIVVFVMRKSKVDDLIKMMNPKVYEAFTYQYVDQDADKDV